MAFFSKAARVVSAILVLSVGACSSAADPDLYGYEENFALPEPDMIPVMPDDNPGRTVNEMLDLKPEAVTVKKAAYETPVKTEQTYERIGRFGSKEKISLRKGLNAPETGVVFSSQKRKAAEEIRPLEVKKQEKDELQSMSEEELLAQIIAPKKEPVEIIEVIPAAVSLQKEAEPKRLLPVRRERAEQSQTVASPLISESRQSPESNTEEVVLSAPKSFREEAFSQLKTETVIDGNQDEIVLLKPPAGLKTSETSSTEDTLLSDFPVLQEKVELIPPEREERIILKRPGYK
ncbi:MAG: hypothetical protein IJ846_04090 [Alphaproteobacteria bacterium]|nr:hypothetical protein [Alphaproteobacteria bacterium]